MQTLSRALSRGTIGARELELRRKNLIIFQLVNNGKVTEIRGKRNAMVAFEDMKKAAYKEAHNIHPPSDPRIRPDVAQVLAQAVSNNLAHWLADHGYTTETIRDMTDEQKHILHARIKASIMPDVTYAGVMYRASRSIQDAIGIDEVTHTKRPQTWMMPKSWKAFAEQVSAYAKVVLYNAVVGGDTINARWG